MSASAGIAAELLALGSATLGESGARIMAPRIKAAWSGARLSGPAITARCAPGDNLAIHVAVAATTTPGAVLVVDASAEPDMGYWGEVLTTGAEARGITGLVIDGCVRDVARLEAHGFPAFSRGIALPGTPKVGPGTVGRRTTVGDVRVEPGDWVVGDADGVVVIASAALADVLAAGRARAQREEVLFEKLRKGATTVELLGLDASAVER